jgi:hypothetical protein
MSNYKWSTPSTMNCKLTSWREYRGTTYSYGITPICPQCGYTSSGGISSGIRPPNRSGDMETCKFNENCSKCKNRYEYRITVTS